MASWVKDKKIGKVQKSKNPNFPTWGKKVKFFFTEKS